MIASGVTRTRRAFAGLALLAGGALGSTAAFANPVPWQLNMPQGVSDISKRVYDLHMLGLYVCAGIGIVVFAVMFVAMFRFRKSRGAVAQTWAHNTRLEVVWTIIPILLLIMLAWPATRLLIDMNDVGESDLTVKVTGFQWRWRYDYVEYQKQDPGVHFISSLDTESNRVRQLGSGLDPNAVKDGDYSSYLLNVDNPLVVPVGVKIRFLITADDVIHSWWVPTLGWKQDAIPGFINDNWTKINTPGLYRGQCAELCGRDHAFMPIVVKAVPQAEFEQWLATHKSAAAATAAVGAAPDGQG
ncbi:cytochrome c oxidase subunit II [Dokdonella sp.]|uniref:cytochrome c oxidase subunit II n=1 Tax=Dokdonella sp. TaxID=2291710 RepID=UPI0031CAE50F|nr:cytochrome c oxidase subunit II [Dokdonella sp.]